MKHTYYERQFDPTLDSDHSGENLKVIFILSTPRSGSHMLGHMMADTGLLGIPYEYFHKKNMARWMRMWEVVTITDYINALKKRRVTSNGVLSIKLHYNQLKNIGGSDSLIQNFPNAKYIHIYRHDQIMQAVSLSKANQDGVWIHGQQAIAQARYSYKGIEKSLRNIQKSTFGWNMENKLNHFHMKEVAMERILVDPSAVINEMLTEIGEVSKYSAKGVRFATKKQQSDKNEEWALRFCYECKLKSSRFQLLKRKFWLGR